MAELAQWPSGLTWLAVIPMLGLLIFVHELGHFLAALRMKVKVEEFGFGYPPRLLTLFERGGVKYTLNLIPLGGFVRMAGEEGDFEAEGSLASKKPGQRTLVFVSGPAMNLLLAVILFSLLFMIGIPIPYGPVQVLDISPDSPAERADMQVGDILLTIGGAEIYTLGDVERATTSYLGREVEITLSRHGEVLTVVLVPRRPEDRPSNQGAMGIVIQLKQVDEIVYNRLPWWRAIGQGLRQTAELTVLMVGSLSDLLRAFFLPTEPLPGGGLAGPIGIARLTGELVRLGWIPFLNLTAFLSLNFFLINLLPLPALDGGRLIFVFLEWIRRGKRIPPEREALVHLVGMALLITFMVVISYFDLIQWIRGESIIPGG